MNINEYILDICTLEKKLSMYFPFILWDLVITNDEENVLLANIFLRKTKLNNEI